MARFGSLASGSTIESIIAAAGGGGGGGGTGGYATRAAFAAATIAGGVTTVTTDAFATPGDKGGSTYVKITGAPPSPWNSANPGFVQSADGAWWRLVPENDAVRIEQFGGKADYNEQTGVVITDSWQALTYALGYYSRVLSYNLKVRWCYTIDLGIGNYYFGQGFDLHVQHYIRGCGRFNNGTIWHTNLFFPGTVRNAFIHGSNQTQGEGAGTNLGDGIGTLEGFAVFFKNYIPVVQSLANETVAALWMRNTSNWYDIGIFNSPGKAFMIRAQASTGVGSLIGNANNWNMRNCYVHTAGWDALKIEGNDVNGGTCRGFVTHAGIDGCGIHIDNGYPNLFEGLQLTGYRNRGWHKDGKLYTFIGRPDQRAVVPGTNNLVWYFMRNRTTEPIDATPAGVTAQWVEWQGTGYYYTPGLPIFANAGGPTFLDPYVEGGGATICHCLGRVYGGNAGFTHYSNLEAGRGSFFQGVGFEITVPYGDLQGTYAQQGMLPPYLAPDLENGEPRPATQHVRIGGARGGHDWFSTDGLGAGMVVFRHFRDRDRTPWEWAYNKFEDLWYWNGMTEPVWRLSTYRSDSVASKLGGTISRPHVFMLEDPGFVAYDGSDETRIFGQRAVPPNTLNAGFPAQIGQRNRGERFFNRNPSVGGVGWFVCTQSGVNTNIVWAQGVQYQGSHAGSSWVLAPNGHYYKSLNEGPTSGATPPTHLSGTATTPDNIIWQYAGSQAPVYTEVLDVPATKPAITGSRGGNAALASLLTQLAALGIITDSTTA